MSVEVSCLICGKAEQVWPSRAKYYKTCSAVCSAEAAKLRAQERSPFIECFICNKSFRIKTSEIGVRVTCSMKCSAKHRKIYMKGEGNHQHGLKGNLNASWKDGKRISNYGYVLIYVGKENGRGSDDYALEHRVLMERHIGRKLLRQEIVHHKNGIKTDNRIENLEIMSLSEHTSKHNLDLISKIGKEKYLSRLTERGAGGFGSTGVA